jgi:NTP pyrophosphatase (non-canonical NTP hydrolase)
LALAGEVGELANIIKKVERGSLSFSDAKVRHHIAMELTDVYVYLLCLAGILQIDLEKAYDVVRMNNEHRFMEERRAREARAVNE